jgi:hypothetical protein
LPVALKTPDVNCASDWWIQASEKANTIGVTIVFNKDGAPRFPLMWQSPSKILQVFERGRPGSPPAPGV